MKNSFRVVLLFTLVALLFQCGGGKKLTQQELQQMSPQDRIQYLSEQVQKHPNDIELKKALYREYLAIDMKPQAASVMEDIIALDPYQTDVQFDYGKLKYEMGEKKTAYRAFLNVLQSAAGEVYKEQIAELVAGKFMVQQVTTDSTNEAFPSFSADGSKIVYQKYVNGNWDIYIRDLASGKDSVLISTPADEELPVLSPDGKYLMYTSNADDKRPIDPRLKTREIYITNLEDGYTENLTQTVADDWLPRFNHKGTRVVFVSDRADLRKVSYSQKQSDIFVMEPNGAFQLQLTNTQANEGGPCFSVDDKSLFFHSNKNGNFDIYVMNLKTKKPQLLIDDPNGDDVNPFASPDSNYIVFYSNRDGNYEIYRARVDGSEQERLTFNPAEDLNPVYSPDGKTIAFHSNRNGNFDIFFLNLEVPASSVTVNQLIQQLQSMVGE